MTTAIDSLEAGYLDEFLIELVKKRQQLFEFNRAYDQTPVVQLLVKEFFSFANVSFDSSPNIYITCTGDAKVLHKAFKILRAAGYQHGGNPPKTGENTWCAYWRNENYPKLTIFFYFTSSVCRRVKVGTKTVEQDVYEMQCGEDISQVTPQLSELNALLPAPEDNEVPF